MSSGGSVLGRVKQIIIISVFLFARAFSVWAQDDTPTWIIMERGLFEFRNGDFGLAYQYFSQALEIEQVFPEAEYWMGRVFQEEGESYLAEQQYLKALALSSALYIPQERYTYQYTLAQLYKNSNQLDKYEQTLLSLFEEDVHKNVSRLNLEHAYIKTIAESGINKLFYLYRLNLSFGLQAASELGVYYYKIGNYDSALMKNLYSVMAVFSEAVDLLAEDYWDFEFPDTEEDLMALDSRYYERSSSEGKNQPLNGFMYCLDMFDKKEVISSYLEDVDFYKSLYYLALSLYAAGYEEKSRELLNYMRSRESAGTWRLYAQKSWESPSIETEPVIY